MGYWKDTEWKVLVYIFTPHNNDYIAIWIYCSTALHVTVSTSNQANIKLGNKYEA